MIFVQSLNTSCQARKTVRVHTSSATPDLLLIQQNLSCWISISSQVAEARSSSALLPERLTYRYCTLCNFCWISNNSSGVASISTHVFWAVPIR